METMDTLDATTTTARASITSDSDDVYVEASETLSGHDSTVRAMFVGEETENLKMDLGGTGDVNPLLQTPDRKRTYEVDSKTITRPKKTSPLSVPLPEVFNQENQSVAEPRPVATSTPIAMSTATSSSSVSPRAAPAATPQTPAPAEAAAKPAAPGTYTKTAPAPPRAARQQTMVVSSALSQGLRAAFEQEKASGLDEAVATRLEARVLALVQEKEREWTAKHDKLGQIMVAQRKEADEQLEKLQADRDGLMAACDALNAAVESGFPNDELERAVKLGTEKFDKLKRHAEAKLEEASEENFAIRKQMEAAAKAYEDNTLAIRMRLKQRDREIDELEQNIAQKKKKFHEIKEICNELIKKADAIASDIVASNHTAQPSETRPVPQPSAPRRQLHSVYVLKESEEERKSEYELNKFDPIVFEKRGEVKSEYVGWAETKTTEQLVTGGNEVSLHESSTVTAPVLGSQHSVDNISAFKPEGGVIDPSLQVNRERLFNLLLAYQNQPAREWNGIMTGLGR